MKNTIPTLTDLFLDKQKLIPAAELDQLEQAADTQQARKHLAGLKEPVEWGIGWNSIKAELPRLFDVSLLDILLASWKKYELLSDKAQTPGKRTTVDLHKRSLSSTHKPCIELHLKDQLIATLRFTIKLELLFKTLKVTVGDGRIWRIELGDCEGVGSVQMGGETILKRTFGKLKLPGQVEFDEGIQIPTLNNPYQWGEAARALTRVAS